MTAEATKRGRSFEDRVWALLSDAQEAYPGVITAVRQYVLTLDAGREVRPDFRLESRMPHAIDVWLVECQSRDRSDHALADKIAAMRAGSSHNRFIVVHEAPIAAAVRATYDSQGTNVYDFDAFSAFVAALRESASLTSQQHRVKRAAPAGPGPSTTAAPATGAYSPQAHKSFNLLRNSGGGNAAGGAFKRG
jgi:hypothetical protein